MTQLGKSRLRVWEALSSCPSTPGPILQRHTLGVARIVGLKIQCFLSCFCSVFVWVWATLTGAQGVLLAVLWRPHVMPGIKPWSSACKARPYPPYYLSNLHIQIIQIPFLSFFCCCYSNDHELCTQLVAVLTRAYTYFFLVIDTYLSCISGHWCLHMLVVGLAVGDQAQNTNIAAPRAPSAGVRNSMITACGWQQGSNSCLCALKIGTFFVIELSRGP